MWTAEHRRMAARTGLRYPSDLTDGEWALIEPMIPPANLFLPAPRDGDYPSRQRHSIANDMQLDTRAMRHHCRRPAGKVELIVYPPAPNLIELGSASPEPPG